MIPIGAAIAEATVAFDADGVPFDRVVVAKAFVEGIMVKAVLWTDLPEPVRACLEPYRSKVRARARLYMSLDHDGRLEIGWTGGVVLAPGGDA